MLFAKNRNIFNKHLSGVVQQRQNMLQLDPRHSRLHIYKGDDHFTVVPKYFVNFVKEIDSCNAAFTKK
jgi:hypothetical protein